MDDGWNVNVTSTQDTKPLLLVDVKWLWPYSKNGLLVCSLRLHAGRETKINSAFSEGVFAMMEILNGRVPSFSLWLSERAALPPACELPRPLLHPLCCFSVPFFSSRLSSPGNRIWARAYNKSVNYLSDLPQRATSCTAQSSCRAPPVRPVRSDGARRGFSASTANTPEQKSGRAENKAASLICGEWKVLNGRQSLEVFLTEKKERVSLTSPVCHSFCLPSPSSNCCRGWWKLGEGAEKAPCPRKYVNFFLIFFLGWRNMQMSWDLNLSSFWSLSLKIAKLSCLVFI